MANELVGILVANRMYQDYQTDSLTLQPIFQPERNQVFRDRYFSQMMGPDLYMLAAYIVGEEIHLVSKRLYQPSRRNTEKLILNAGSAFEQTISIHSNEYFRQMKTQKVTGLVYRYQLRGSLKYLASSYLLRKDLMKEMAEHVGGDLLLVFPSPAVIFATRNSGEVQADFAQMADRYQRKEKYGEWGTKNLFVFQKEKGTLHRVLYDRVVSER